MHLSFTKVFEMFRRFHPLQFHRAQPVAAKRQGRLIRVETLESLRLLASDVGTLDQDLAYQIVDTAQIVAYGTGNSTLDSEPTLGELFYGQDSNYLGNQPDYTVSSDGKTVSDKVTGLVWTKSLDWDGVPGVNANDQVTITERNALLAGLNSTAYGGRSDWRIPTVKELYSLIQFDGVQPLPVATTAIGAKLFIEDSVFDFAWGDTTAGDRIIDMQVWSDTTYSSIVMNGDTSFLSVNFADGRIKAYPYSRPGSVIPNDYYAMFVAGNSAYGTNEFTGNIAGTVMDNATGLMWTQEDSATQMNWEEALGYVQQRNAESYLGYSDWRLPNAKELQSLVDYSRSPDATDSPAISDIFSLHATEIKASEYSGGAGDHGYHWTSTTFLEKTPTGIINSSAAVYVSFFETLGQGFTNNATVLDVHGAGAQRTDPKIDNSSLSRGDFFGPQLDLISIRNYVMLVRTPIPKSLPVVSVEAVYSSVLEDSSNNLDFIISRVGDLGGELTVYVILGGTSESGIDYAEARTSVVIPDGATSAIVGFSLVADANVEPDETLILSLVSNENYEIGTNSNATMTVLNDDLPTITVDTPPQRAWEDDGIVRFSILISSIFYSDVVVPLNISGTARSGDDYTIDSIATIIAGETSGTVEIYLVNDSEFDGSKTIGVMLGAPSNATLGSRISYLLTVDDDESDREWSNEGNIFDVNHDGYVSPLDALIVINTINWRRESDLDFRLDSDVLDVDVNYDGFVTALDVLIVINKLNQDSIDRNGGNLVSTAVKVKQSLSHSEVERIRAEALDMLLNEDFASSLDA